MRAMTFAPLTVFVSFVLVIQPGQSANILFFFQVSTYSHRIAIWPFVEALADNGHNVTFHTIFHPKEPNSKIREFFPTSLQKKIQLQNKGKILGNYLNVRLEKGPRAAQMMSTDLPVVGLNLCTEFLQAPETDKFFNEETFDLVVIDALFNECGYGLAHRFGAKTIVFATTHPFPWVIEGMGVVEDTSVLPDIHVPFPIPMTFVEKVISTLIILLTYQFKTWFYYAQLDDLFRSKFNDPEMPTIAELEQKTSLVLYNSHFSEEEARSLPPMFVPIGGLHCAWAQGKTTNQSRIPPGIAKFIEDAGEEGFIYVSFGSEVLLAPTPPEFQEIFYKVFASIDRPILWKWDGPRPQKMSPNVLTAKWMPQQEILASKNIRAFITHGGLLGMQEAISSGVPMIAMPVFAEQDYNAYRLEQKGRGIKIEASTLTLQILKDAIHEILTNPTYKKNVEEASRQFKDRPETPLETALYWTEYVLRHNTTSMRPIHAQNQFWFQRRLLDVWAFIFLTIFIFIYIVFRIIKKTWNILFLSFRKSNSATLKSPKPKLKKN